MAKSTALVTDITTVITNGPNAATTAKAIAAAGPIMDYPGNCNLVLSKFQAALQLVTVILSDTDGSDPSKTAIQGISDVLSGTGSPSTAVLTDLATIITAGPTAATKALAIAAAGPIMDYPGNMNLLKIMFQGAKDLIGNQAGGTAVPSGIITVTDSTDTANLALLKKLWNVLV